MTHKKKNFANEKELMKKKYRFRVTKKDLEIRLQGRLLSEEDSVRKIEIDLDPEIDFEDFLEKIKDRMGWNYEKQIN
jgi:hypothetical protein